MTESHGHQGGQGHHGNHDENWRDQERHSHNGPYWRRMHRDWKMWIGVTLMLVAIAIYIWSENESLRPGPPGTGRLQQPVPAAPAP
jgi:hypothetical protein